MNALEPFAINTIDGFFSLPSRLTAQKKPIITMGFFCNI